ncbi:MAG: PIN domain-containing protein [Planctomycetota bacterium]
MKRRIYVDTSVIGGCLDKEFWRPSRVLFERFEAGEDILVISDLTLKELQQAPSEVRAVLEKMDAEFVEEVEFTREASDLAEAYIAAKVVHASKRVDAQHIATAAVHDVDVLVSWNFRQIVNLERIRGYNTVNLRQGYAVLEIRTPREVIAHGEEEEH